MKVILTPNAFKESMTAAEAAAAMNRGFLQGYPGAETVVLPVADGGDGTAAALVQATGGRFVEADVTGPLGEGRKASFALLGAGETAAVEMASASGLALVPPEKRDPKITTTYGTGQLIKAALDAGAKRIIVGIGGSATSDGGAGMAQALGAKLLDKQGRPIGFGGAALLSLAAVDVYGLDPRLRNVEMLVASDVQNPLTGPTGAAAVYGPQKGASAADVALLDQALAHYAAVLREQGKEIEQMPGAGAAGGLGAGLVAFLGAKLLPGAPLVLRYIGFAEKLQGADLVLTGEGRIDRQTLFGKAPYEVMRLAKERGVPTIALVGRVADREQLLSAGFADVVAITPEEMPLSEALPQGAALVAKAAQKVAEQWKTKPQ